MKKLLLFLISCLIFVVGATPSAKEVYADDLSESIVLHLSESHTDDQIIISAKLIINTGVSGMTLELVYDKDVFDFSGYERGQALSSLDLVSTNLEDDPTLPVKFNWLSTGQSVENDFTKGDLLKIFLTLKEDAKSGEYNVGFKYDAEGDIVYISNNQANTKTAIIDKAIVNVADSKISEIEIKDGNDESEKDSDLLLTIAIAALSVGVAGFITMLIIKAVINKRRKENWLKL